ncbi:MAG: succinylglutamate-semialdehyde dehydrogenase [Planctomycetota bacterium]
MTGASSTHELISRSPIDGSIVWSGPETAQAEITAIVQRARRAQMDWASASTSDRIEVARQYAAAVERRVDELAALVTLETGKLRWDARAEARLVAAKVGVSIAAIAALEEPEPELPRGRGAVERRPIGVCAVLGPFNFPAHLPNGQIVPALLAGNAVVFKPSEKSPAVGEWLIERWQESGCPADLVQLAQGGPETARHLTNADIDGVLFTGSRSTGVAIHRALAGRPEVLLALEMGGNAPVVVHPEAEPSAAAYQALVSAYISSGQRCTCARRLIVPAGAQAAVDALTEAINGLKVGLPADEPEPFIGPLIDDEAASGVLAAQARLIEDGATPLVLSEQNAQCASLLTPGLVDATPIDRLADREVFGPLLVVRRVNTLDDAFREAARTRYGLAASLLGGDRNAFEEFLKRVPAGVAIRNGPTTGASAQLPFGGVGHSGNHRPAGFHMASHVADAVSRLRFDELEIPETIAPGISR